MNSVYLVEIFILFIEQLIYICLKKIDFCMFKFFFYEYVIILYVKYNDIIFNLFEGFEM